MKKILAVSTALSGVAFAAQADITVLSWGGAYETSQVEAYNKPFAASTGIGVNMAAADNPATPIKAQVEAGNVSVDVADIEYSDAVRLCDEGLLEVLAIDELPDGVDGTPAAEDFIPGGLTDCAVASIVWSTVVAYNANSIEGVGTIADFFDLEKFPGKRGLRKGAKANLEMALMADGVAGPEVYEVLATPEGVDRAFAKLDTIKGDTVWWEAGAQPQQLLADGEVVMTTGYNGRVFAAAVGEGQPFSILWDGQILDFDLFVIPKGAPNKDEAWEYIKFATASEQLAAQATWISYGPARLSSAPLVGLFMDGVTEMGPHMPTAPDNLTNYIVNDFEFWADRDVELNERFNAWLVAN
ncbi:polyamine ABC transporter substrate-binding protein [Pseudogemmobacter sonorensis]|uniref:ABC transporter substrate-binding protein n=1 Tax=Pseudogemmobacter sonorensis TaxID=2989681 RepID=UPI0036AAD9FC